MSQRCPLWGRETLFEAVRIPLALIGARSVGGRAPFVEGRDGWERFRDPPQAFYLPNPRGGWKGPWGSILVSTHVVDTGLPFPILHIPAPSSHATTANVQPGRGRA